MAPVPSCAASGGEDEALRAVDLAGVDGIGELAGALVASEDGDAVRVLEADEEEAAGGIEGDVARSLAAVWRELRKDEGAGVGVDVEFRDGLVAAIAGVDEATVGRGEDLRAEGCAGRVADGECGDGRAVGGEGAANVVPEEEVDSGVELVDVIDPLAVGVEREVTRAGLEATLPEWGGVGGELTGAGVDLIDEDAIGAEVVDEEEAAVG